MPNFDPVSTVRELRENEAALAVAQASIPARLNRRVELLDALDSNGFTQERLVEIVNEERTPRRAAPLTVSAVQKALSRRRRAGA